MTDPQKISEQTDSKASAATPPPVPDHQLIRPIGTGGSGQVWLARNALGTFRAVKIVYGKKFESGRPFNGEFEGVLKFEPISRAHDGLVDVLQVGGGSETRFFYCVMELADDVHTGQAIDPGKYLPARWRAIWPSVASCPSANASGWAQPSPPPSTSCTGTG